MSRELWPFYEQELRFIREQAREFGKEYPREAGFLSLESGGRSSDPHVERMVQAFALLAARIRHKIDDNFPELTDALLTILQPNYLAPLPSLLIAQLVPHAGADLVQGLTVSKHCPFRTTSVNNVECEFRTVYPVTLWPIAVSDAQLKGPPYADARELLPSLSIPPGGNKARLRIRFELPAGGKFEDLGLGRLNPQTREPTPLRLFLDADGPLTTRLYELLFNNVSAVTYRLPGTQTFAEVLPEKALTPVGFRVERQSAAGNRDEGVLPYADQSFPGYRLLSEFFAYRDKFWFADLGGWDRARMAGTLAKGSLEVHIFFDTAVTPELEQAVSATTFRLGCVPMVNLFRMKSTEGIRVNQTRFEYPLVPNEEQPHGYEIYSVDEVYHRSPAGTELRYEPFYSFRHQDRDRDRRYWFARRRPAGRYLDRGTEIDIHFVDADFNPKSPAEDIALAGVTCLNRDLPSKLRENPESWSLLPVGMVVPATVKVLRTPTPTLRPMQKRVDAPSGDASIRKMQYWRLISHLSLNHLSLADSEEGRLALTEYLALYDFSDDQNSDQRGISRQIRDGILRVGSRDVAFVSGDTAGGYARGMEIVLELDEEKFVGTGSYLFASVMERYFALAASINSFTRLTYRTRQRGPIRNWPARAGDRPLV